MRITLQVEGLDELRRVMTLDNYRHAMAGALKPAFEPARLAIQAGAPRGEASRKHFLNPKKFSGGLATSVYVNVRGRSGVGDFVVIIGSRTGYGHIVDVGHRIVSGGRFSDRIGRREGRAARLFTGGRLAAGPRGRVTGFVPAHPFVERAFRSVEGQVVALIEQRIAAAFQTPAVHAA